MSGEEQKWINMKRIKLAIISIIAIGIILFILILAKAQGEFKEYLKINYPNNTFKVYLPKIDIIYGSYYSDVVSIDDNISFKIIKSWNTKEVIKPDAV